MLWDRPTESSRSSGLFCADLFCTLKEIEAWNEAIKQERKTERKRRRVSLFSTLFYTRTHFEARLWQEKAIFIFLLSSFGVICVETGWFDPAGCCFDPRAPVWMGVVRVRPSGGAEVASHHPVAGAKLGGAWHKQRKGQQSVHFVRVNTSRTCVCVLGFVYCSTARGPLLYVTKYRMRMATHFLEKKTFIMSGGIFRSEF